ncbi:hypothetical protein, partial [Undibacterium rugosum]|uniref:hypothetical protein n=1 Tax=Undibacterium rugosum TaxID=2762291 RepID=UPI001B8216DD
MMLLDTPIRRKRRNNYAPEFRKQLAQRASERKHLTSTVIDFCCLTRSLTQAAFYAKRSATFQGNKSATRLIG